MGFLDALPLAHHLLKRGNHFWQNMRALMVGDHKQEIAHDFAATRPRQQLLDHPVLGFAIDRRARQKIAQLVRFRIQRAESHELLGDRLRRPLRHRDIRERIRVLQARGFQFGLPSRLFTNAANNDSCACGVSCFASSDSAPSTARFAAITFSSSLAARSAASISAFPASPIFCASLWVIFRIPSASAEASRCAAARSCATSSCRRASFSSASRSWRSASALAAVAFVIAELMFSAFLRKNGGVSLRKTHPISPATITKLIHLKISLACSVALPLSSAARALTAAKNKKVAAAQ